MLQIGMNGPDQWMGEEIYFFRKCREAGLKLFVDADLSREIGHIGEKVYTL